ELIALGFDQRPEVVIRLAENAAPTCPVTEPCSEHVRRDPAFRVGRGRVWREQRGGVVDQITGPKVTGLDDLWPAAPTARCFASYDPAVLVVADNLCPIVKA